MNHIFNFILRLTIVSVILEYAHGSDEALQEIKLTRQYHYTYGTMENSDEEEQFITPHYPPYSQIDMRPSNLAALKKQRNTNCFFCCDTQDSKKNKDKIEYEDCFSLIFSCCTNNNSNSQYSHHHSNSDCDCDCDCGNFDCDLNFD